MFPGDAVIGANDTAGGDSPEAYDQFGLNDADLAFQPADADLLLRVQRIAVAGRAAFHNIADIIFASVKANDVQHLIQQLAAAAHKGDTHQILLLARTFADQHDAAVRIAVTKDKICPRVSQCASLAGSAFAAQSLHLLRMVHKLTSDPIVSASFYHNSGEMKRRAEK